MRLKHMREVQMRHALVGKQVILLGLLLVPVGAPLSAQPSRRWTILTTTRTGLIAFDSATVDRKAPRKFEAWLRFDADPDDSVRVGGSRYSRYSHSLARYGLDCGKRSIAQISITYYDTAGTVVAISEADSVRWQLALPESRGEDFLRSFCDAMEGRRRATVWLLPRPGGEYFSPGTIRVSTADELAIFDGHDDRHELTFDTLTLNGSARNAVRDFMEFPGPLRSVVGLGDVVVFPKLPAGSYYIYCATHSALRIGGVRVEVSAPPAPRTAAPPRPAASRPPRSNEGW